MRYWSGKADDDGSIHCLGNGKLCVYEQGPDIIQIFGPPYSSPSLIRLEVDGGNLKVRSERETGTAIWRHEFSTCWEMIQSDGNMLDFVDSETPCFIRRIQLQKRLYLQLCVDKDAIIVNNTGRFKNLNIKSSLFITAEGGSWIYNDYPMPRKLFYQVVFWGSIEVESSKENSTYKIRLNPGESIIYIIAGTSYPECIQNTQKVLNEGIEKNISDSRESWTRYTSRRYNFEELIGFHIPYREKLIKAIDDVAVLIKTQQGEEGGVLAGHRYHLAYIRDQYGVFRCMLKLGYIEEAKAILEFYRRIWQKSGRLHNAQAIGVDGIFHVHENDEVEITGYLIIQAFDFFKKTGDSRFLHYLFPMLEWAFEVQKKHLVKGMLPFNGDETYIAGGVIPRNTLNDGSAEATLLFVSGAEKLIEWASRESKWSRTEIEENLSVIKKVVENFKHNFWRDGKLMTNNPERKNGIELPEFRHGVCEHCSKEKQHGKLLFGWTEKNKNGRYLCPECISKYDMPAVKDEIYYLQSVSLTPLYIGSNLFAGDEIGKLVDDVIQSYKKNGQLPSRPGSDITVGYDYGLLLTSLTELGHPAAGEIYEKMMSVIDRTGAWVEYYIDGRPEGTRCRPWESGINLEAAISFALSSKC